MARRINTRFVTILGGSALGVVGIIFLADKLLIKARPDQYISAARQDMTQHDWADADKNWAKAIAISPQDPDLWTQDGYALHQLAMADPQVAAKHPDLNAWQTALEIDPKNVPAMKLVLDYWRTQMQVNPTNIEPFRNARDEAEKLLKVLPSNDSAVPEVTSFKYTATVRAWIAGLDTDNSVINDTAQKMQALAAANPSDTETPYYLALIDIQQGKKLVASSADTAQPAAATALFEKPFGPNGEMTSALARQDKSPLAHYHAAQLYTLLADVDHSAPETRAKYAKLAADEMDRAVAFLKPKDAQFVEISLSAAQMALASNDRLKAAAIVRGLLKQNPDPITVVQADSLIDEIPDLRPQAIDLLQSALDAAGSSAPLDARRYAELGALTHLQISQMTSTDSDEARASLKDQIGKNLKRMAAFGDPLPLITEEGRLAMVEQDYPGAIQAISNGMAASPNLANDPQLVWMLAQCYTVANERESAKEYLRKTIHDSNPSFLRPREMLIEQLAAENTDEARREMGEQIAYLQRTAPDDPDVMRLQMLEMDPVADADRIKAIYPQIPEKTVEDMLRKATVAELKLKNPDEAVRLLTAAHNADPENQVTVLRLAHDQDVAGQTPGAIATIQRALAAHPNDPTYQLGLAMLQKAPADEIAKLKQKLSDQRTNDPKDRDLQMAQDSLNAGNLAGAEVHLKAAEAQAPADKDIWVHLFEFYLTQKDYDKAQPYLQKLTAANYDQKHGLSYEFELAQAKGDTQRQVDIGLRLTSEQPEFAASYYYLGLAYQAQGQWNQAVQNYSTAMLKKGVGQDAADMLNHEIDCYYRMNQPDKAKVAIEEGRRQFPRDTRFLNAQIKYEMTHGDAESAEKELSDLVNANPDVPDLYRQLATARMQICQEKVKLGDMPGAGAEATAARDLLTGAVAKFPDDAQIYGSLADILIAGGDRDGAEKILLQLDARPDWKDKPDPQKMLAEAYEKMARQVSAADAKASYQARAEAAYAAAIARAPKSYALRIFDSEILAEHKKYDEAIKVLDGDQTGNPKIRLQRINIMIAAGRIDTAEKELQAILDQHPDPSETARLQGVYARLELADKNLSSAAEHANLALAADPQNVMALVVRARLRMAPLSPDPDGAIKDLTVARQAEPDNVEVLLAMADAYLYRFDAEQAASVLESAVRLQPQNVPLRLELVRVYSDYEPVRLDQALQVIQDGQAQPDGDRDPDLANAQASIYKLQGKPDLALQTIVSALNRNKGDLTLIRTYLQALLDNSQYDQAVKESSVVIQQDQKKIFWWAWRSRGEAKAASGDKSGAAGDLKQALAEADGQNDIPAAIEIVQTIARVVSPDMAISLVGSRRGADPRWDTCLVMLYHQHGEDDQAMQILDPMVADAAKLPPAQRVARLEMAGMIYGTAVPKPLTDKSYEMYVELLKINPINIQALNNIASLCADGFTPPKIDEGLRYIRTAQRILAARGASDANVDDTYGWLLILAGQTQQGMDILTKATAAGTFPDIYYHLGEGYLRENRPTDAQVQVTNALNAIATAQQHNQTISPFLRAKVADLSNRVLDSLRPRTTGNLP